MHKQESTQDVVAFSDFRYQFMDPPEVVRRLGKVVVVSRCLRNSTEYKTVYRGRDVRQWSRSHLIIWNRNRCES